MDDPNYGKMAGLGRIVNAGFVPAVEGYYFHRKWKGLCHPCDRLDQGRCGCRDDILLISVDS